MTPEPEVLVRIGHSPDADDAFMFYALAHNKIPTGRYRFVHELADIETLNRRALRGELELTALSLHAYAYVADKYVLCTCGASIGDGYGPILVSRFPADVSRVRAGTVAVPGTWTTAFLVLSLYLGKDFRYVVVPFDRIPEAVSEGHYGDVEVSSGLVIHEGQLTYADQGLHLHVDLGKWWKEQTGLPLPLGANGIRRDFPPGMQREINQLLRHSIDYALANRDEALAYAQQFGRGLDSRRADRFVGMYVNHWTQDFGAQGREAVAELLRRGYCEGIIPQRVVPEFVA